MRSAEGSDPAAGPPELRLLPDVSFRGYEVTGPRLRGLLALLAGEPRTGVGAARLVEGLWPDAQPEHPAKALQVLVSRARSQLGAGVIASTPNGYRLAVPEARVDAHRLTGHAAAATRLAEQGDPEGALAEADAGLELWDGDGAGGDVSGDPLRALRAATAPAHRSLLRARALALSRLGRRGEALEPLTSVFAARPQDEEVLVELLRCDAATAGPSSALARYDRYRRGLRERLGSDPGPALQAVHRELLDAHAPAVRHGVVHEPNELLGRDADVAAVLGMVRGSRVTSIVGPGGLGKTRLAHAVGRVAEQRVVHVVGLAGISEDGDVAAEVASALGEGKRGPSGPMTPPSDAVAGIVETLGRGPVLLVLDNCEHVVTGVADLVSALVAMSGELRVLTTSRTPLGLSSESTYPLPELALPTAVELFTRRARAARPGVELPGAAVEELCRHLDGLPLAVELAAARVRTLSVPEIARRLDDRFALLRGGARDTPARHRTLHAVVDWSWTLLEPDARQALRTLSTFPGGFTADAAGHVLDGDPTDVLEHLVGHSLLQVGEYPSGLRFRMLETVREFCSGHRDAAGETEAATSRFLAWARAFGTEHHDSPFGARPRQAMERIRAEQDNLLVALRSGLARSDGGSVAATTAVLAALWTAETVHARVLGLARESEAFLSHYRPDPEFVEVTRTAATLYAGATLMTVGPRATRSLVTLRRIPPAPADTVVRAAGAVLLAMAAGPAALHALWDGAEPLAIGAAHTISGVLREYEGDLEGAMVSAEAAAAAFDPAVSPWMSVIVRSRVSDVCLQLERGEEALWHAEESVRILHAHGTFVDEAHFQWSTMLAHVACGHATEAGRIYTELGATLATLESSDAAMLGYLRGLQAEIELGRGEVDAGLASWRDATGLIELDTENSVAGTTAGALEILAAAVAAHGEHGRLDLVGDRARALPRMLVRILADRTVPVPSFVMGFPWCGAAVLGMAVIDAERDPVSAARLVALAQRLHFVRTFAETLNTASAMRIVARTDPDAHADAVSAYAALGPDELRGATLAAALDHLRR